MKKNLPKVFASPITRKINNNKDIFYSQDFLIRESNNENIYSKINSIFASKSHVYKSKVLITTIDNVFESVIVGKTKTHLLTLNGEKILINDILDIEKK